MLYQKDVGKLEARWRGPFIVSGLGEVSSTEITSNHSSLGPDIFSLVLKYLSPYSRLLDIGGGEVHDYCRVLLVFSRDISYYCGV